MNIVLMLLLLVAVVALYFGFTQFQSSLKKFLLLPLKQKQPFNTYALNHLIAMTLISTGFGLLGVSIVLEQGMYLLPFAYPFIASLSVLWLYTALQLKQKKDIPDNFHPLISSTIALFILPAIVFIFLSLDIVEPGLTYPLPKGFPFEGNPIITFYAVFILSGAMLAYRLSENEFIRLGKKKGFLEDIFLVAFPAGILGARLWYVWGQWDLEFSNRDFFSIFAVWEGGLAIMGGAIGGALAGILYVYFRRKDIHIVQALDFAVPTILVAQAIGRWGNFFNQEVFGELADVSNWAFLPTFIQQQMTITLNGVTGFRVPLFLIESMINLTGYFVIKYAIGRGLKSYRAPGDLALMYLVWYGLTRGVMEPLRNPFYNMGNSGDWSFIWGWVFFSVGLIAIVLNHVIQRKRVIKHD
jgi:prolipoprotein diacylglyceryl transferase